MNVEAAGESVWLKVDDCKVQDLAALVARRTAIEDYPRAGGIAGNIPIYDGDTVRRLAGVPAERRALQAEWIRALSTGPGVVACRGGFPDLSVVDAATRAFETLIADEKAAGSGGGDHFAKPGANDRVWNAIGKLGAQAPDAFVPFFGNEVAALMFEAWLGPGYQMTAQVNSVNPGGEAQQPHRDYHLGFHTVGEMEGFPRHVHLFAPRLVLQGAIAHCDMPLETGPTLLLPYSQLYPLGYLASGLPAFREFFAGHRVQLPLAKGDLVFFNPAVIHAAGSNRSQDVRRMATLLQVFSPYARPMESVDRDGLCIAVYPAIQRALQAGRISLEIAQNAISAASDGFSFPTNLDRDPPIGGMAPESQQALMRRALGEGWESGRFAATLRERRALRVA
jgi:ectoine hydroxylase-related dioxygenase (phytanoyl-CoA dioxygenase family)